MTCRTSIAQRNFVAELSGISAAVSWVVGVLRGVGFAETRMLGIELAIAEVVGNIARHAYPGRPAGPLSILIETESDALAALVTFVDEGDAFDPLVQERREREGDDEHGMGLTIIDTLADGMSYERVGKTNRFTLRFEKIESSGARS